LSISTISILLNEKTLYVLATLQDDAVEDLSSLDYIRNNYLTNLKLKISSASCKNYKIHCNQKLSMSKSYNFLPPA